MPTLKQRLRQTTENIVKDYLARQKEILAYQNDEQLKAFVNDVCHLGVKSEEIEAFGSGVVTIFRDKHLTFNRKNTTNQDNYIAKPCIN